MTKPAPPRVRAAMEAVQALGAWPQVPQGWTVLSIELEQEHTGPDRYVASMARQVREDDFEESEGEAFTPAAALQAAIDAIKKDGAE